MYFFEASLLIISCIKNSQCIRGPNNCISEKKGQVSPFAAQEIVTSSTTTDFQMCHLSYNLSYWSQKKKKKKKIIIGVFIFSIISFHNLCQQNQNAFLSHERKCSSGPSRGGLRDRLRRIRSKWVLCFLVNKRLYGFEVINHKKLLCS